MPGLDESLISYLFKLGYHSPDNLLNAHAEDLASIPGVSEEMALQIQQIAFEVKKRRDEDARVAREAAAAAIHAPPAPIEVEAPAVVDGEETVQPQVDTPAELGDIALPGEPA